MIKKGLPAAYERILNIWQETEPLAVVGAKTALDILLCDLIGSPKSDCFMRSTLTITGSPFEPAFSFISPGLRYTVDPAPPEIKVHHRLNYVLSLLERMRINTGPPELIRRLGPMQAKGELRYGAQIGARHGNWGDSYKLYIELPAEASMEADELGEELLGSTPVLNVPDRNAYPTLVGIDLATDKVEIYYRIENLHPLEISTLLKRANAAQRAPEILAILEETQPRRIRHELPGSTWGFSYSMGINSEITFSIYTFARTLFGTDGRVRDAMLKMGCRHGWDLASYDRISAPLDNHHGALNHHGIFGLVVSPGIPPAAWIGLAPPEPENKK